MRCKIRMGDRKSEGLQEIVYRPHNVFRTGLC